MSEVLKVVNGGIVERTAGHIYLWDIYGLTLELEFLRIVNEGGLSLGVDGGGLEDCQRKRHRASGCQWEDECGV